MQQRSESIIRAINNKDRKYKILTYPTHESFQVNWATLPHIFYLYQKAGTIKPWNQKFRLLPKNHILLDGSDGQIKNDMRFDFILSMNKFGHFQVAKPLADALSIPFLSLEHTLPLLQWTKDQRNQMVQMRGDINIFISRFSVKEWGFDLNDPTVRVIEHGIDTDLFKLKEDGHKDEHILTVVNDWINRDHCCNFAWYKEVCLDANMPVNPVGDTFGLSKPANGVNDLVSKYQDALIFLNTSTISPVPMSLMESMSTGCCAISNATCMIPEIIEHGKNGLLFSTKEEMKDLLNWARSHPDEARAIGEKGRETIINRFSLERHLKQWSDLFDEVYGMQHTF